MTRPAVFLDRDGTMIEDIGYLSRLEQVRWYPYTVDAIRMLKRAGFLVCVTTNQSGISHGLYSEDDLRTIHGEMDTWLRQGGAEIDAWYYCPHHPEGRIADYASDCECRKPGAGMIREACRQFDIDLPRSFVVGDKALDVGSALHAGARGILVRTGYGEDIVRAHAGAVPDAAFVAMDLMEATSWILQQGHVPSAAS